MVNNLAKTKSVCDYMIFMGADGDNYKDNDNHLNDDDKQNDNCDLRAGHPARDS